MRFKRSLARCMQKGANKEIKKQKSVNEIEEDFFVGSIESNSTVIDSINTPKVPQSKSKFATLVINGQKIKFKIDTGASQTVISEDLRNKL